MKQKKHIFPFLILLLLAAAALFLLRTPLAGLYQTLSFRWEDATDAQRTVKAYADQMGISYGAYPESLIELLERNPETEAFVLNYPFRQETEYDLQEYAGSDTVPLFLQWDPRWGYEPYGSSCMAVTGCGPTCLAMVGYYLTGDAATFDPAAVAKFAWQNGYYASGYGSSWTLISEGGETLGLTVTELPLVKKRMTENLEAGNPIILALGAGDFTSSGHYIVLTGLQDGLFVVNDPNSMKNSVRLWSYEELEPQIRNIWAIQ